MTTMALGRRADFDAEVVRQLEALRAFALKLTRSHADAEDLVSDTVVRALDRSEQFEPGTNLRAWLFTILYHIFVSQRRRSDARDVTPIDGEDGRPLHEPVGEADPEGAFYDSFVDESVMRAIWSLPDEYREAVILSDMEELQYAEIARRLRIPEGTVKSRLFRGRRLLQKKLRGYAESMGYIREPESVVLPLPLSAA